MLKPSSLAAACLLVGIQSGSAAPVHVREKQEETELIVNRSPFCAIALPTASTFRTTCYPMEIRKYAELWDRNRFVPKIAKKWAMRA